MSDRTSLHHAGRVLHPIPGFRAYYAASDGSFWSTWRLRGSAPATICLGSRRRLTPSTDGTGYVVYQLSLGGGCEPVLFRAHRLLCWLFHGPPPAGKPLACHRNDVKLDNRAENLYWGDWSENLDDSVRNGRRR